ncbi:Topoisomerase 1-associated factor 1 [Choanephora cucurbitarum]|uniref:Topoisomerase 1-associated factor 1 n=1 Tax=Choanephora cucurbitarum TaxID=101091 RepID=A0A1C7NGB0_9FUNG|nr:Topoisomerase 1-associated factor 1 [Choanephora cucurbitarum]
MENDESDVKTYILNVCSAIGGMEEIMQPDGSIQQIYCVGDEALACLRDLKKAIRIDSQNSEKTVLNALAECNVVETDIVPLILSFSDQQSDVAHRFILACVELLVPMTWPVEQRLHQDDGDVEEEEEEPNALQYYRKYKAGLLKEGVFETILQLVMRSVRIPHRNRSIVDHTTIRLGLYLFRNLTAIPDLNMPQSGTIEQIRLSHMQEMLMIRYYESDIIEFLLTIASNSDRQEDTSDWNVLVLESLYNLLKSIDPKDVYAYRFADNGRKADMQEISKKLSHLLSEESSTKRRKTKHVPTRHNRFGGTYVMAWDGKQRVSHKQEGGYADYDYLLETEKKKSRVGKRKLEDKMRYRKVYQDAKALMYLRLTAQSFLFSCFNAFCGSIIKDIQREDPKIMKQDYARFFFTMRWFLEYHSFEQHATDARKKQNHLEDNEMLNEWDMKDFDFALVAAALDLKTVLFCLRHMRMKLEDKQWFDVQMVTDCLRQILVSMNAMHASDVEEYRKVAEHIQSNLYYEQTSLDLFVDLIRRYKIQSYGYLKSVILFTHVLLRSLDNYKKGKKVVFVRKRQQKKKKKPSEQEQEGEGPRDQVVDNEEEEEEYDEAEYQSFKDSVFNFEAFEKKFITYEIVNVYCSLLECYEELQSEHFVCIASMFHRMMVKRNTEYLFWKLPVMELFNRILCDYPRLPESNGLSQLRQFIIYSTRQFFKCAAVYPLAYVEALVPSIQTNRLTWENSVVTHDDRDFTEATE